MKTAVIAAAASLASVMVNLNALHGDFVYDDSRAIVTNPDLNSDVPISSIFANDFWGTPLHSSGSHKSYRPLCVLTFRLNHLVGGLNPFGYHIVNVALHAAITALYTAFVGCLVYSAGRRPWPTLVAGLLFAVHPVHVEAVASVVGRADLLAALFFLLCLLCYSKYERDTDGDSGVRRALLLAACVICAALAMLSKETGIMALAVCASWELAASDITSPMAFRNLVKTWRSVLGLSVLFTSTVMLLLLRLQLMGFSAPEFAPADNPAASSDNVLTRALTFWYLPAANAALLFWPTVLSFDWSMDAVPLVESLFDARCAAAMGLYAVLALLAAKGLSDSSTVATTSPRMLRRTEPRLRAKRTKKTGSRYVTESHGGNSSKGTLLSDAVEKTTRSSCLAGYGYPLSQLRHTSAYLMRDGRGSHAVDIVRKNADAATPTSHRRASTSSSESIDGRSSGSDSCTYQRRPCHRLAIILGLALTIFPFLPASNLFFYVGFVMAERVLYIPSMGFCLLVAHGISVLGGTATFERRTRRSLLTMAAVGVVIGLLSARTILRNADWANEESLYTSGLAVNPAKAWGNLANTLKGRGNLSEAERAYTTALRYRGNMADVHYNYGVLLQEQKRYEEAISAYRQAIRCRPQLTVAHLNLGITKAAMGAFTEAEKIYRHCADVDSGGLKDPRLHDSTKISCLYNLGRLHAEHGHYDRAIDVLLEAVARRLPLYPSQSLFNVLGEAYFNAGDLDKAEHWYIESLKAKPDHVPAHQTMAKLLHKKGKIDEAAKWFVKAIELKPNDVITVQQYAHFLFEGGKEEQSVKFWHKAALLAPRNFDVLSNVGNALRNIGLNKEAEGYFQQAAVASPQTASGHANLGAMLHINGKYSEAESSYVEALRLDPHDSITLGNLKKVRNVIQAERQFVTQNTAKR